MSRFGKFLKFQMHLIGQLGVGVSLAINKPPKTSLLLARSTQLTFDSDFNMPMNTIVWSDSIRELTFGLRFNQSIENVKWPSALQLLTFGSSFNQPITGIV